MAEPSRLKSGSSDSDDQISLHNVARENDIMKLQILISLGVDVNEQNSKGETALHVAVGEKATASIITLLKFGINADIRNMKGLTALQITLMNGWTDILLLFMSSMMQVAHLNSMLDVIEYFIENEDKVIILGSNFSTLLYFTAVIHNVEAFKLVLKKCQFFDVNAQGPEGENLIHFLIDNNGKKFIRELIDYGVDVNVKNEKQESPLLHAFRIRFKFEIDEIIHLLVENGANVNDRNADGETSLHCNTLYWDSRKLVNLLLENGGNVNIKNNDNQTPLHCAIAHGAHVNDIESLLENNADVNAQDKDDETPLHYVFKLSDCFTFNPYHCRFCKKSESFDIVNLLIKYGANVNVKNLSQETALLCALRNETSSTIVKYLISKDSNLNARNADNETVLHLICDYPDNLELGKIFLERGIDVNARDSENVTPLLKALYSGASFDFIKLLLNYGADVTVIAEDTLNSVLHLVSSCSEYLDLTKLFLDFGADVNAINFENEKPIHGAFCVDDSVNFVKILLEHGADLSPMNYEDVLFIEQACIIGNVRLMDILFEKIADINVINIENQTLLQRMHSKYLQWSDDRDRDRILNNMKHLTAEIVKRANNNEPISVGNLEIMNDKLLELFYLRCVNMISQMQKPICSTNRATYYDFLNLNTKRLIKFCRDKHVLSVLKTAAYQLKFTIYAGALSRNINKAITRMELFNSGTKVFQKHIRDDLAYFVYDQTFEHLNNEDLESLSACDTSL